MVINIEHFLLFLHDIGLSVSEFHASVKRLSRDTACKRNSKASKKISERILLNFYSKNDISYVNPQPKTKTHFETEYDIRSAISNIVMWEFVFRKCKKVTLVINFDAC